jgi:hypothetical protein
VIANVVFWVFVLAIIYMLFRPSSAAGNAIIALADAFAAMIATTTGAAAVSTGGNGSNG